MNMVKHKLKELMKVNKITYENLAFLYAEYMNKL